jgi:hypothetical protein
MTHHDDRPRAGADRAPDIDCERQAASIGQRHRMFDHVSLSF